jgi:hypothetical protein
MNFFSKVLKQKKIIVVIFLFLIILGVATPKVAQAGAIGDAIKKLGESIAASFLSAIILGYTALLVLILGTISSLASALLLWVINAGQLISYTGFDNPAIAAGWPIVRDLANMIIVLGFVIIGIATALRIKTYEAKQLLPKLIIAAILINFSLLICGIAIDGSNILTNGLLKGGGFMERSWTGTLASQMSTLWEKSSFTDLNKIPDFVGTAMGLVFFDVITSVIFFMFFFLFLFRYVALWILVILSPLAFVCYVFPFTKKFSDMWLNNFVQWCIIGAPAALFIYIADKVTETMTKGTLFTTSGAGASVVGMLAYIIPSVFLIAGFLFSLQTSAMGAGMATGAAKWVGGKGKAMGGALASGADKLSGGRASGAAQKLSSATGRTMERWGLRDTGATAAANNKQVENKSSLMSKEYTAAKATGDTATIERIQKQAKAGRGFEGAAAMKVVSDAKDLGQTFGTNAAGLSATADRMKYAEAAGATGIREKAEKLDPRLLAFNRQAIDKAGGSVNAAVANGYQKLDVPGIRELSTDAMRDPEFVNAALQNPKKLTKAAENMTGDRINEVKKLKIDDYAAARAGRGTPEAVALMRKITSLPIGSVERSAMIKKVSNLQTELKNSSYLA